MPAVGYVGGDPGKVSRAGDTMTGDLGLPGNPDAPLEAAPKQYVDALAATSANQFSVGNGVVGAKSIQFNGTAALVLQATPTVTRTITVPDATGVLLLGPDNVVEQVVAWTGADRWVRIDTPFSAGDNNPDLLRIFNGANQTFRLNGNGEVRKLPSAINRVGDRAFEFLDGSNDIFWECSTNPTNSALRETLLGVYGTLHGSRPGWVLVQNTLLADALQATTSLSVGGQAIPADPVWVNATLGTSIVKRNGQAAAPGSSLERGKVTWRGSLQWPTGVAVGAGYQLAQVTAAHRPASGPKSFSIRTVGSGSNISTALNLHPDGWLTPEASLGTSSGTVFLPIDGLTWDLS